jgi:hypothetical protein
MKNLREMIRKMVKEALTEMTATGDVAGYQTPGAFRKKGKNAATAYIEKMGFTLVGDVESSNDGGVLSEAMSYDSSKDMNDFRKSLSSAETSISQKFSSALKQKLLGKNVELTGSKGYGQFKTKYTLRVFDITVEDWYGKEDYQLIITGDDKKQYFVDVSVPIQITDVQSKSGVPAASVPTAPTAQPKKPIQPTNATVKPVVTKAPVTDLEKAITK